MNFIDQHLFSSMIPHLKPFDQTYAAYAAEISARMAIHPTAVPGSAPPSLPPAAGEMASDAAQQDRLALHPTPEPGSRPPVLPETPAELGARTRRAPLEHDRPPHPPPGSSPQSGDIPIVRTTRNGVETRQTAHETFAQTGKIVYADHDRIVQSIRGDETFTYRTDDLLRGASNPASTFDQLQTAARLGQSVTLSAGTQGLELQPVAHVQQQRIGFER
jgi:hypothetical protein